MEAEVPCVDFVFQRMVQLVARAFYAIDLNALLNEEAAEPAAPAAGNKRKRQPADFSGLGVVVLDALMHRPWWEEEEFARKLGLPVRPVRQVLRLLETHSLVSREHRKERKRKADGAPAEAEAEAVEESQQQERGNLISYCSLDYARMFDATRLRLHRMRRRLKDELEDRRAVAEYTCPACARTYTTLQAPFLIKGDGLFHCEDCNAVLQSAADGGGGGLSRRERAAAVKAKQAALEEQLRPLTQLLADIERRIAGGEEVPDFGTLASWAAAEAARSGAGPRAGRAGAGAGRQQGPAQIRVDIQGPETRQADDGPAPAPRELPPWLQRQQALTAAGASGSYSLSQELTDAKDAKDVKSASPADEKKAEVAEYMRQYKARMEAAAAAAAAPGPAGGSAAGGWQEVPAAGGWAEVKPEPAVKQEPGAAAAAAAAAGPAGNGAGTGEAAEADEDEWEDA